MVVKTFAEINSFCEPVMIEEEANIFPENTDERKHPAVLVENYQRLFSIYGTTG